MITYKKRIKNRISRFRVLRNPNIHKVAQKHLAFVPHLFTLGNAFFGFCSLVFTMYGEFESAAYFILLGALMDSLDGRLARLIGVSSNLGVQMDSLSDLLSFCVAPAFLMYAWQLKRLGFIGILIAGLFAIAGLVRLARFNIMHEQQTHFFMGVPTTMAGCFLSSFLLYVTPFISNDLRLLSVIAISGLVLFLSWLMISSVPFPTFKKNLFHVRARYWWIGFITLFAFGAIFQLHEILFFLFGLYFLFAFVYSFSKSKFFRNAFLKRNIYESSAAK